MAAGFKSLVDGVGYSVGAPPIPPALGGFIGLLDFTGMSVGSLTSTVVQPDTGELVATGYEPNIVSTTGTWVFPEPGVLTVTAYAPTVETPNAVQPTTAALTVTSYAPQVLVDTVIQPGTGALTVTGYAPAMARYADCVLFDSTHITLDSDALTWDLVSRCVNPAPASMIVTGYAPTVVATSTNAGIAARDWPRTPRRRPRPEPRYIPWLDPYVPWLEVARQEPVTEELPTPAPSSPGMAALVGAPGQNLPLAVASLPDTWGAELADRLLNAQDIWEAVQRRQAVQAAIEAVIVAKREAEADDEEALMVLE